MESSLAGGDSMLFYWQFQGLDLFFGLGFLLFKDVECHVEDSWVVEDNDAPVGTRFNVHAHVNAEVIV